MLQVEEDDDVAMVDVPAPTHSSSSSSSSSSSFNSPRRRRPSPLRMAKTPSTSILLLLGQPSRNIDHHHKPGRVRFSFDATTSLASPDSGIILKSPIMNADHDHGLGASGLRRIRQQQHNPRNLTLSSSASSSRAPSIGPFSRSSNPNATPSHPSSRKGSGAIPSGLASPSLTYTEDLSRFPSESLHSFSFAHQSEDFIHNRQNVLKRTIEFMRDGMGHGQSEGIMTAQAKLSGDQELQSMVELLSRARLLQREGLSDALGPLTGPPAPDGENLFDKSFFLRPESIKGLRMESPPSSPRRTRSSSPLPSKLETPTKKLFRESESEVSSRTPTSESKTTAKTSPPPSRRPSLKRTLTDTSPLTLQSRLIEALAQPFLANDPSSHDSLLSPTISRDSGPSTFGTTGMHPAVPMVHGYHTSRWAPTAQAIFTTDSEAPWTILAANDLACLVFGVTKAEVKKVGILEVIREERRAWLEEKLKHPGSEGRHRSGVPLVRESEKASPNPTTSILLSGGGGVTAQLLSKPSWRERVARRAQSDDGAGSSIVERKKAVKAGGGPLHHASNRSRGVLLCGDVVPIQKRNGHIGSASLWVKEKRNGLIWVLEEIHEDVADLSLDDDGLVTEIVGSTKPIWGEDIRTGTDIGKLLPKIPRNGSEASRGPINYAEIAKRKYFTARYAGKVNMPAVVDMFETSGGPRLRVSSFPHIAGIMVLSPKTLKITSSNSVFSAALFGQAQPDGMSITNLIPGFDRVLQILTNENGVSLVDGIVIPEHSFRRARVFLAIKEGRIDSADYILHPDGLPARHRDGSKIMIDVQMRVVKSDMKHSVENVILETSEDEDGGDVPRLVTRQESEVVYALWITYSRHLHARTDSSPHDEISLTGQPELPFLEPSSGQAENTASPIDMDSDEPQKEQSHASLLTKQGQQQQQQQQKQQTFLHLKQTKEESNTAVAVMTNPFNHAETITIKTNMKQDIPPSAVPEPESHKKTIDDFVILEEMGQGAYGQVKLARYKRNGAKKMVIKYVTKKRILMDTWTRDRRLGTVPLEIHVLDFLRRPQNQHVNIIEMHDFFEDEVNYYIEMIPHGLPGMDLFDYIELRVNMGEDEVRGIFKQVVSAVEWLHSKGVVHRDIKDENVVMDGAGVVKLIDFGSAAYIRNGPFNIFVGTIDYAAPEVLGGHNYRGPPQDIWALGILLYTIIYKENPFYDAEEITDRDLRVPYVISEDSIALIRAMLDRNLETRASMEEVAGHAWFVAEDESPREEEEEEEEEEERREYLNGGD